MPALYLEQFGIESPPAVVWSTEEEALQHDAERPAEEEFDLDRWVTETTGGLSKLVSEAAGSTEIDLDRAIAELEKIEIGVRRFERQATKIRRDAPIWRRLGARSGLRDGVRDGVREMTYFVNAAEHWLRATGTVLPALRDTRWQLMAIRAEREDSGGAPTFDDADALIARLTR